MIEVLVSIDLSNPHTWSALSRQCGALIGSEGFLIAVVLNCPLFLMANLFCARSTAAAIRNEPSYSSLRLEFCTISAAALFNGRVSWQNFEQLQRESSGANP
jgi:hypothetical protein